jgi:hypothetical protein
VVLVRFHLDGVVAAAAGNERHVLASCIMQLQRCFILLGSLAVLSARLVAQSPNPVKNLIENGDFSAGASHWQGDGRPDVFELPAPANPPKSASSLDRLKPPVAPLPPLPPLPPTPPPAHIPFALLATPGPKPDADHSWHVVLGSKSKKFSQRFGVPRQAKLLQLTFHARTTPDFQTERTTLGAIQIKIRTISGTFMSYDRQVGASPVQKPILCNYTLTAPARYMDLIVEVFPGSGELYFDDFVVQALEH